MGTDPMINESGQGLYGRVEIPQVISLDKAEEIAGQVHELVQAGNGHSALELIRHLHPADMGSSWLVCLAPAEMPWSASCPWKPLHGCCGR